MILTPASLRLVLHRRLAPPPAVGCTPRDVMLRGFEEKALKVLSDIAAQSHQIAEASLFSPKQYWKASALLCSLLLGLQAESAPFAAAAGALRYVQWSMLQCFRP